jgi:hypothetical protein
MDWLLQRYSDNGNSTQGLLFEKATPKNIWLSHSLEDEWRDTKVMKETRIPEGLYELKIIKVDTPLTLKHRVSYNISPFGIWFRYHIEITGVKNFSGIYIHAGNRESHTDGCLLLGDTIHNHIIEPDNLQRSIQAVKRFYDRCYQSLEKGGKSFLEIRDEYRIV